LTYTWVQERAIDCHLEIPVTTTTAVSCYYSERNQNLKPDLTLEFVVFSLNILLEYSVVGCDKAKLQKYFIGFTITVI